MTGRHPETEIAPYLAGELAPADRARVAAHLESCARCRDTAAAFRSVLGELAATAPTLGAADGARYTAETWRKLRVDPAPARRPRPARVWRVVPLGLAAGLAGVLVLLATRGVLREPRVAELPVVEEVVLGDRLELLRDYPVVENLELLEDLEVIRNLDRLADGRRGAIVRSAKAG